MHGLINQFINEFPILSSLSLILITLALGLMGLLLLYFLFTEKEPMMAKTKLGDFLYVIFLIGFSLMSFLTGSFNESIVKITNLISFRPSSNLLEFLAFASAAFLLPLVFSAINFLSEDKAKRARIVFSVLWVVSAYLFVSAHRVTIEGLTLTLSPLMVYWAYRYIQGKDHKDKYSTKKKAIISFSIFTLCFLMLIFLWFLRFQSFQS